MLRAGLLVLLGALGAGAFAYAIDGDLAWQQALGEVVLRQHALPSTLGSATFTAPDARWFPHEWIFATVWALAERTGLEAAFRIGCALVAFAALSVDAIRARGAAPRARTIALALVVAGMLPSFGLRAQVLAWPLLALVLLALESGPRGAWWVVPIAVVWDNLHASGLSVPVIVLVHGFGRVLEERRYTAIIPTLALAAAGTLAMAATPFGLAYAVFAAAWSVNPATDLIAEWQPASLTTLPFFVSTLVIVVFLIAGEVRGVRLSWSQRLLTLALLGTAFVHVRNLSLFCIVAGPWAAAALTAILPREPLKAERGSLSDRGLVVIGALAAVGLAIIGARLSKSYPGDPSPAVAQLVAHHHAMRVACEDFSWCSRFAATPNIRVFMDGRVDAYPGYVVADYRRILAGDSAHVFERWQIDVVIAKRNGPLAHSLQPQHWRRVRGGATQIFVRV